MRESFLEGTASPSYPVELDASNAVSKPSRRSLHKTQRDSDIKHLLEQTGSPDSVVCLRIIEEHKDGLFLICQLKAIANELGQSEALVGGTSTFAEPGLPRAEERLCQACGHHPVVQLAFRINRSFFACSVEDV